jgi:thioredoxin reductase
VIEMEAQTYDVVVIGGGAAGLSAALVLGRARRRVAVVDAGEPRNAPAAHMQGFLSRDGMPPSELLVVGRAEVERYGVEVVAGEVASVTADFQVHLTNGDAV